MSVHGRVEGILRYTQSSLPLNLQNMCQLNSRGSIREFLMYEVFVFDRVTPDVRFRTLMRRKFAGISEAEECIQTVFAGKTRKSQLHVITNLEINIKIWIGLLWCHCALAYEKGARPLFLVGNLNHVSLRACVATPTLCHCEPARQSHTDKLFSVILRWYCGERPHQTY